MNSTDIHQYVSSLEQRYDDMVRIKDDLIKQNAALDGELEQALRERDQALEALQVAHDTILDKQARITQLEAKPDMGDDVFRFLADIEWVFTGWEAAINRQGSTVTSGLKELDSLYRKLWPVGSRLDEEEGAA